MEDKPKKHRKNREGFALTAIQHDDVFHIHIGAENISRKKSRKILKGRKPSEEENG